MIRSAGISRSILCFDLRSRYWATLPASPAGGTRPDDGSDQSRSVGWDNRFRVDLASAAHRCRSPANTVPGIARENYWFRRHEVVYQWIVDQGFARGTLVEAGVRRRLRSRRAPGRGCPGPRGGLRRVRRHPRAPALPRVQTMRANLVDLPLRSGTADVVVSLQVIEHLWDLRASGARSSAC